MLQVDYLPIRYTHRLKTDIFLVQSQVGIDMFVMPNGHCDVASLGHLCRVTGGSLYRYGPVWNTTLDFAQLHNDLRWNVTRPQGMEAVMRVRASTGLNVSEYGGFFCKRTPTDVVRVSKPQTRPTPVCPYSSCEGTSYLCPYSYHKGRLLPLTVYVIPIPDIHAVRETLTTFPFTIRTCQPLIATRPFPWICVTKTNSQMGPRRICSARFSTPRFRGNDAYAYTRWRCP